MPTVPPKFYLPSARFRAAYLGLGVAELHRRAEDALALLRACAVCPRDCGINRLEDRYAVCKTGRLARVSSFFPHLGEEDCLRGWRGSGTIFFAWCNLKCVFCVGPEARVFTDHGLRSIEQVFAEAKQEQAWAGGVVRFPDRVRTWTHNGRLAPIAKVFRHHYDGEVVVIKPLGLPALTITPDHTVFAAVPPTYEQKRVPAGMLTKRHFLVVPKPRMAESSIEISVRSLLEPYVGFIRQGPRRRVPIGIFKEIALSSSAPQRTSYEVGEQLGYHPAYVRNLRTRIRRGLVVEEGSRRNELIESEGFIRFKTETRPGIPGRLTLDADLGRLLGYYCAEGHVHTDRARPNSHQVVFSYGQHETSLVHETRDLMRKVFGVEASIYQMQTTATVQMGRSSLALLFKAMCGSGARGKCVPRLLFEAPPAVIRAFLEGYFAGDGSHTQGLISANTVSAELAHGLVGLLLRIGIFPYFYVTARPAKQRIGNRVVNQAETLYYVKCRLDAWRGSNGVSRPRYRETAGAFLVPIRHIERSVHRGAVYNVEVDDPDHSFITNGIGVDNCQNSDISQLGQGRITPALDLARMMIHLQDAGCHNINFVTPEHVVPQVLEALPLAVEMGLRLPLVYNTSAYDSLHSLHLLDGVVDIYMPDFKFWDREASRFYLKAPDYPEAARQAIREMHRQVGVLKLDEHGLAARGVLLRHLVMPGDIAGTREIFQWLASELSPDTYVNVMDQYRPAGRVGIDPRFAAINRPIAPQEFGEALRAARDAGLHRLDTRRPRSPNLAWVPA